MKAPSGGTTWPLTAAWRWARWVWARGCRGVRHVHPEFWGQVQREFSVGRHWADRVVVLGFAILTGVVVVAFTLLAKLSIDAFRAIEGWGDQGRWIVLLWTPALTVALLWLTRRFVPDAAGSGIPQVLKALDERTAQERRSALVSLKMSFSKVGLVSGGMLAGLSIGREGPTVQVGAGVMAAARPWLSPGSKLDAHDLMVAGAAAGIAAAFNTPLGGIVFALEQLTRRRGLSQSTLVIAAIVLAGLVSVSVFGNATYFGRLKVQQMSWDLWWPGLTVALLAGLTGGLFARLIVVSARGLPDRFCRWRARYPYRFAAACGLAVAVIGWASGGATAGAGYLTTRQLLEGEADLPGVYTLLKFCATWISAWSGVPAGVFAPSLAIGAGLGHDVAWATNITGDAAIPLIALGMVGLLAATTGGPITAFIIVMEMVSGHAMVLSLMACALLASAVARMITRPMYDELASLIAPGVPAGRKGTEAG
jgi:H+/Cl- antiporter ClcA